MSYQSPYQPPVPPPGGYSNFSYYDPDALAPARRAGGLLFAIGGLGVLGSLCCGGVGLMIPQFMQQPEFSAEMEKIPGATVDMMRAAMLVAGGLALLAAITFIVLGLFVWRGSKAAAIVALVLAILSILVLGLWTLSVLVAGASGPPQRMLGACFLIIPIGLMILLVFWLLGAMKAADHASANQYAMQYWQYAQQQQQQTYSQHGYGGQQPQQQPPQPPPVPPEDRSGSQGPT